MVISLNKGTVNSVQLHCESEALASAWKAHFSDVDITTGAIEHDEMTFTGTNEVIGKVVLFLQINDPLQHLDKIIELISQEINVVIVATKPSPSEGLELFKRGVKGYLPSHFPCASYPQVLATVLQGNVWLGQNIMIELIKILQKTSETSHEPGLSEFAKTTSDWQQRLTQREIEVAHTVLEGKSNREIAEQLFITERTVKSHVKSLLKKFGAKDRLALVLKIQAIKYPT